MLDLIVLVLLCVNLFMLVNQNYSNQLKRRYVRLINCCIILVLETILVFQHILANESYLINILIIISQVIGLFCNISLIRVAKREEASKKEKNKDKYENNSRVVV